MAIKIQLLSNGVWRVNIGLIEEHFIQVDTALEWVKMKMDEAEASLIASVQNTSGT